MPKEVPGTISQTFREFSHSHLRKLLSHFFNHCSRQQMVTLELPLSGGAMALFWFVGVHGPSIVEPAIAAIIYANVETNLQLFKS